MFPYTQTMLPRSKTIILSYAIGTGLLCANRYAPDKTLLYSGRMLVILASLAVLGL